MNIYLEIFGYIGTALVLTSMLMTSVVKLRLFNAVGSLVSMIYAYLSGTWPVVILNLSLLVINALQLVRLQRAKVPFDAVTVPAHDRALAYFLDRYRQDIAAYFPGFSHVPEQALVYMVCREAEVAGVFVGIREENTVQVVLDYTTPKYRDCSVAGFLFQQMARAGVASVRLHSDNKAHVQYLKKMGFAMQDGQWVKEL